MMFTEDREWSCHLSTFTLHKEDGLCWRAFQQQGGCRVVMMDRGKGRVEIGSIRNKKGANKPTSTPARFRQHCNEISGSPCGLYT